MSSNIEKKILNNLRKAGYENKLITYKEFLDLYEPYCKIISEKEFAKIVKINYSCWQSNKNARTTILKIKYTEMSEERKNEIQQYVKRKGYSNKIIYYTQFLDLYQPFKHEISESDFAVLLGISKDRLQNMRSKGNGTRVFKTNTLQKQEEIKNQIRKDLKEHGYNMKPNNYSEFFKIYEHYKNEFDEETFASILRIQYNKWTKIKADKEKADKLNISVDKYIEIRKSEIINKIKTLGYINKLIDYKQFLSLYETYQNEMNEVEFADILGIKYSRFISMKVNNTKSKVLREPEGNKNQNEKRQKTLEIPENRKNEIIKEVTNLGVSNKLIDYNTFLQLYSTYKMEMSEIQFANLLGISHMDLSNLKKGKSRARILKETNIKYNELFVSQSIDTIKSCMENGMARIEAIEFCMKKNDLTQKEMLEILKQYSYKNFNKKLNRKVTFDESR